MFLVTATYPCTLHPVYIPTSPLSIPLQKSVLKGSYPSPPTPPIELTSTQLVEMTKPRVTRSGTPYGGRTYTMLSKGAISKTSRKDLGTSKTIERSISRASQTPPVERESQTNSYDEESTESNVTQNPVRIEKDSAASCTYKGLVE